MDFSDGYGYEFECNRRIGKSTYLDAADVDILHSLWIESNDQNIFVFCKKCNTYMYFETGKNNALDGKYICPVCGRTVKESTPYTKLEKENEAFLSELEDDDYYDEDDDEEYSGEYYKEVYNELDD